MSGAVQLLILIAVLVAFWAIVMRPARRQQRTVQQLQTELSVGDEVIISAGIFGTVRSVDDSKVDLEIAPGTVVTVARQVVVRRAPDDEPVADTDDAADTVDRPDDAAGPRPPVSGEARPAADEESE